jgi:hypothetical protein
MMPISQVTVNILRAYIADHGSRAMLDVVAVILEERAGEIKTEPERTVASINARVIRDAMKRGIIYLTP